VDKDQRKIRRREKATWEKVGRGVLTSERRGFWRRHCNLEDSLWRNL
jgi:hypothetical protein